MKNLSIKNKVTGLTTILVALGFAILVMASSMLMRNKITDTMISQFKNETNQVAGQAAALLEQGGTVKELQKMVEDQVSENNYIAYAVVIDKSVTAVAHSDKEKIGKSYSDDTAYTVPAAKNGQVMTSKFWAELQNAWTYDVMTPIYVNGSLYGSMDLGIYNTSVSDVVKSMQITQIIVALIMLVLIAALISLICKVELNPLNKLVEVVKGMESGDFTVEIPNKIAGRNDEVGRIAKSMSDMKDSLSNLIDITARHSGEILSISESLNSSAQDTQEKAADIAYFSDVAVAGTQNQSNLTRSNSEMTKEIANGMDDIANNIMNVTATSNDTAQEARNGESKIDDVVNQMSVIESNVSDTFTQIQELERMSDNIQNVINLIADIAAQTNLLALNASIEAARAGEQGKGFAVVADQVGTLADQSKNAANDIGGIIHEIQNCISGCVTLMQEGNDSVKDGMNLAREAKDSFTDIIEKINQVSDEMTSVSAVTEEVTSGTSTLYESIMQISQIAETVSGNTDDVSKAAQAQDAMMQEVLVKVGSLSKLSLELKGSLGVFKISEQE